MSAPKVTDEDGTLMEIAAMNGDCAEIRTIFARNRACVNNRGNWQWTPIMRASDTGQNEAVSVLMNECGADLQLKSKDGHTALHIASAKGNRRIVKDLIHGGADVDAIDTEGRTPLMMACYNGHAETVKELISHRAELDRRNKQNKNAKDLAKRHKTIYDLLHLLETAPPRKRKEYFCGCLIVQQQYHTLQAEVDELTTTVESLRMREDYQNLQKKVDSLAAEIQRSKGNDEYNNIASKLEKLTTDVEELKSKSTPSPENKDKKNAWIKNNAQMSVEDFDGTESYGASGFTSRQTSRDYGESKSIKHRTLSRLAKDVGHDYYRLGYELGMEKPKLTVFVADCANNTVNATVDMLIAWQNTLHANKTKEEKVTELRSALKMIDRHDLIVKLNAYLQEEEEER